MKRLEVWQKEATILGVDLDCTLSSALKKLSVSCQANATRKNKEIDSLQEKKELMSQCGYSTEAQQIEGIIQSKKRVFAQLKLIQKSSQTCDNDLQQCLKLSQDRLKDVCNELEVYKHLQNKRSNNEN